MELSSTSRTPTAGLRPGVIRWPRDESQRQEMAQSGRPCLLVVAEGEPIPQVGRGEAWVRERADEREVAARVRQLQRVGRPAGAPVPPVLPPSLGPVAREVAVLLAASPGSLVSTEELEAAACVGGAKRRLAAVLAEVRRALEPDGWTVDAVPRVGYVLSRSVEP
jgi:hypothetical protein